MSNVTPTTPPLPTTTSTSTTVGATTGSAGDSSQQQQQTGAQQGGKQAPAPQQAAPAPPAVTLAASLAGLREGMRFKGTMIGNDANGQPVVKTPNGTYVLANASGLLTLNGEVELEIRGTGNLIRALILSIGGKPQHPPKEINLTLTGVSGEGSGGRATPGVPGAIPGATPRGFPQPNLTIGSQITATVQTNATPNSPAVLPGGISAAPGNTLILKIVDIAAPASGGGAVATGPSDTGLADELKARFATSTQVDAGAGKSAGLSGNLARLASVAAAPTTTPASGTPATPVPAPTSTSAQLAATTATPTTAPGSTPAAAAPQGSQPVPPAGTLPVTQADATAQPTNTAAATTSTPAATLNTAVTATTAGRLTGEVVQQAGTGQLVVRTPIGDLALATRAMLQPGTRLEFETVAMRAPEAAPAPSMSNLIAGSMAGAGTISDEATAAVQAFSRDWPALKEAMTLLQSVNPALAQQVMNNVVPTANSALANSILVFIAAIRGGDVRGWLGDPASRALEGSGGSDLLNRLSNEMSQMGRAAEALTTNDWRAVPFPFLDGASLQQIWAFVREHRRAADEEDQKALRFIVELDLSRLGGIQLDGLVQDQTFNLMIRSVGTLPENVRQDISGLFNNSLEATAYSGSVVFDPASIYPVSPLRDAQQGAAGHGEITA